ncbi:cytochrome P450 302a1, mitochondrial isoform X1 [Parasteatoda tepidariorum]|uniref:cytochrome P450 302a1, mitochondrial isoform X1 n=2 Tax=Parasteatoda tepidariorum TaxID=114398 RepID=UPI001C723707|nr:cytochrome P450 302a1, mitochondrial isoform X1 [Parasteatoda tepidariorum]
MKRKFLKVCVSRRFATNATAKVSTEVRSFEEIPGPVPLPLVGTMLNYLPFFGQYNFWKLHRTYAKMHQQYGDVVKEVITKKRIIVHVFNPEYMSHVYVNEGKYPNRLSHTALAKYRLERPNFYSGPGLFPSNGEEWQRFRDLFQIPLFHPSIVKHSSKALEEVVDDLVVAISNSLDKNEETDLLPLLYRLGLECIGYITLNKRLGCLSLKGNAEADALVKAAEATHMAVYLTENVPFNQKKNYKKLEAAQDILSEIVGKYFDEALKSADNSSESCIVHRLMRVPGAEKRDVFTMILDMFLAGIDTTSFALSFGLYHLARCKRVQDTLREQLREVMPTLDTPFTGVKKPNYLKAVVQETLRINPVAIGTGRVIPNDLVIGGYLVPANTMVILQHQVASIQEKYFKNSKEFEPERWLSKNAPRSVSAPFGSGKRLCIGRNIAQLEINLAIAKIIRNFELSYHYEDIDSYSRLINVPDKPVKLRMKRVND